MKLLALIVSALLLVALIVLIVGVIAPELIDQNDTMSLIVGISLDIASVFLLYPLILVSKGIAKELEKRL